MSGVKVPANLPDLVGVAFQRAKASGDISFFPTQVAVLNINGVPVCSRDVLPLLLLLFTCSWNN